VFLATVNNIDWPRSRSESSATQLLQLIDYVDMMSCSHFNAVVFQIRAAADALYNSSIEPWSKYVHPSAKPANARLALAIPG